MTADKVNQGDRREDNIENSSEPQNLSAGVYDSSNRKLWNAAPASSTADRVLAPVTIDGVQQDSGDNRPRRHRKAELEERKPEKESAPGPVAVRADYDSNTGLPTKMYLNDGTTQTYTWSNGILSEVRSSEGYSWKFEFDKWYLYDSERKRTGDSTGFIQFTGRDNGLAVSGRITENDYRELAREMQRELQQKQKPAAEEDDEVIKISTEVKKDAVETDSQGRVKQINYLDGSKRTFDYDKDGELVGVTGPQGKRVRVGHENKWKLEGDEDKNAADMTITVDKDGTFLVKSGDSVESYAAKPDGTDNMDETAEKQNVSTERFNQRALQLFSVIDKDHDDVISDKEMSDAMQNPAFQGEDAQVVAALYKGRNSMRDLSDDDWFADDGTSREDISAMSESMKTRRAFPNEASALQNFSKDPSKWAQIDKDGDGKLTLTDVNAALSSGALDPQMTQALKLLQQRADEIAPRSFNDRILAREQAFTPEQISKYLETAVFDKQRDQALNDVEGALATSSMSLTSELSTRLYRNPDDPLSSIKPDAVRQGSIGDCYFEAPLASLAHRDPAMIKNMIRKNGDGTYTVTFPGSPDKPVTFKEPTQAEMAVFNRGSQHGIWAAVMEKAYGAYIEREGGESKDGTSKPAEKTVPTEAADGGGQEGRVVKLLTGKEMDFYPTNGDINKMREELTRAFSDGQRRLVTAGTPSDAQGDHGKTKDGFPTQHAYAILNFDPNGPGGGQITVRNPWGLKDHTTGGVITITLDQFVRNFSDLQIQKH
jgi:YD repeat-containing protein